MSWKKNERPLSPMEFIAAAEKLYRKVYEDTKYNFGVKDADKMAFVEETKRKMLDYAEMIDFYVQSADSHYPHSLEILRERRIMQDNAIAACRSLKRKYQINLDILGVPRAKYHDTVELIEHEITVIQGWRKSDNKWEKKLG